jgi:hypothetical protein
MQNKKPDATNHLLNGGNGGNEGNRDNAYNLSNRVLAQHLA